MSEDDGGSGANGLCKRLSSSTRNKPDEPKPPTGGENTHDADSHRTPARLAQDQDNQAYMLLVCRALMTYGAPTHRLETYMQRTASALQLPIQAFHLPGCMIISFDETSSKRSKDVQIITATQSLDLSRLKDVHTVYKETSHKTIDTRKAVDRLDKIIARDGEHPRWLRVLMYGLASAFIGPISYSARPIDLPLIFLLGSIVGLLDLVVTEKSVLYGYIFEMTSAALVSFVARALGSVRWGSQARNDFCFSAIAQASLVMILPGFIITNSALELQSRMMISGAVRLVYGIIYTLFLAFGFIIGITIYGAIDSNATSSTTCSNPWPFWWQVIFVIPFAFCYAVVNQAKWKQIPGTLVVTLAGWLVNHFSAQRFATIPAFTNALGALTVGLLSNLYSRLGHGLALEIMHPAIFILVPGSFAASGALIDGVQSANEVIRNATAPSGPYTSRTMSTLSAGYAMVEIAIGITAGLSLSALIVYPVMKRKGGTGLFSY